MDDEVPDYGYVAYIDEAGDDGLKAVKPNSSPGASEWLILSAVVVRAENQSKVADWVASIAGSIPRRQAPDVHFKNLNAANKASVCRQVAELDVRCFVIASNKKNMEGYSNPAAGKIPSSNWFYCWMTRILLERVTRFVGEKSAGSNASRHLRIEYSARGGLKYSQMAAYYEWMKGKSSSPFLPWGHIVWDVMHPGLLKVFPHQDREGLQLADIVASAFFKACDKYDTGACDPTFAKLLEPRMARSNDRVSGQISGYGVKLLPNFAKARLDRDQAEIFRFYGYPRQWWEDPAAFSN